MIIGIGHKARRGKDTFAQHLVKNLPKSRVLHFSDALYEEVQEGKLWCMYTPDWQGEIGKGEMYMSVCIQGNPPLGYTSQNNPALCKKILAWADDPKTTGLKRHRTGGSEGWVWEGMKEKDALLLQWWGTEFRRCQFGEDYWVDKLRETIEMCGNAYEHFVIPDTRFPNEAEFCDVYFDILCDPKEPTNRADNHPSEIALDDYIHRNGTQIVPNEGTLEDLEAYAIEFATDIADGRLGTD